MKWFNEGFGFATKANETLWNDIQDKIVYNPKQENSKLDILKST